MGKEEGGGFRMGNTCIPVADSFRYLAKPIQYCKVKKKKSFAFLSLFLQHIFFCHAGQQRVQTEEEPLSVMTFRKVQTSEKVP